MPLSIPVQGRSMDKSLLKQMFKGIWSAQTGMKDEMDLLTAAANTPRREALERMVDAPLPFSIEAIAVEQIKENKYLLTLPHTHDEILYGLGLNFKRIDVQGSVRHLHMDHFGGEDNGRTHAPAPFLVSSQGYGMLINKARYISVYTGNTHRKEAHPPVISRMDKGWQPVYKSREIEIIIPGDGFEIILFSGPTVLDVVRRYNLFCGGGCLPPKWGLGFWHRTPSSYTAEEVEEEAKAFETRGFPLDVIGLEPGWHSCSYPTSYEWSRERFPDPKGFIERLADKKIRVNVWENPFVSPQSTLGRQLEPFSGTHTGSWGGLIPDLSIENVREMIQKQHESEHLNQGVSGYKIDECDGFDQWLWPDHAAFPSGLSGETLRQVYGVLFQRLTLDMFRRRNMRTYGLTRASNAGTTSFPYVLYNDYYSHPDFITALCSSSLCGLLWTPEARSASDAEDWLRRIQSVCFSPLAMLNAWADGTKPWSFPEVSDAVRDVMLIRMQLIPYLYSAFAQYYFEGIPPFRAMVLEPHDASDPNASIQALRRISNQYMAGPCILVAPMFAGKKERTVILPPGKWFDFYTGALAGHGPTTITITPPLERIPLFVCDGGIVPMWPEDLNAHETERLKHLEVRYYGTSDGCFEVYDDDGLTYDYEQGTYALTRLKMGRNAEGKWQGTSETVYDGMTSAYDYFNWRFMTK
jgi:alpha-glucosidase (family GH31 glycosyl hydrolase)